MNALFMTQGSGLYPFYELMKAMRPAMEFEKVGFYVTNSLQYSRFIKDYPSFEREGYFVVKEWELMERAQKNPLDLSRIRQFERALNVPSLWPAVVADRRVYLGKRATLHQDYSPRFDQDGMLRLLQQTLGGVSNLFDQVQPDVVFSFVCVTMGEFLAYLFAKSRGARTLNLRPTRIKNCMTWGSSIFEPSADIEKKYQEYLASGQDDIWCKEAKDYLMFSRKHHALYEGVVVAGQSTNGRFPGFGPLAIRGIRFLRQEAAFLTSNHRKDHHNPGIFTTMFYRRIVNPWTAHRVQKVLGPRYVTQKELSKMRYAFFPLHTEPEVTLLVYSKAYMNQIEGIRAFSHSLPVGMNLVVKEHPASVGKRGLSYYRKILQIPNVVLADPAMNARTLIEQSELVAIIVGSVGFEALMLEKPVVALGRSPFEILPSSMMRRVENPESLADEIQKLLANYRFDERALVAYIAATLKLSAHVDFYSVLLKRGGVYRSEPEAGDGASEGFAAQIRKWAEHTMDRIHEGSEVEVS